MKIVAVMVRRLNEGVSYEQFRAAWIPDEVVAGDPRVVISALSTEDTRELCTLAVVEDVEEADVAVWMQRLAPIEERRYARIKDMVGEPIVNSVYRVVAEDALGEPITV